MRILLAIAALALLVLSASTLGVQAQGAATARQQMQARDAKEKPPKADDQAYKDALKQIPTKKADPWGNMR
jgi:Spy/CpxP family protein refolding chaperone